LDVYNKLVETLEKCEQHVNIVIYPFLKRWIANRCKTV